MKKTTTLATLLVLLSLSSFAQANEYTKECKNQAAGGLISGTNELNACKNIDNEFAMRCVRTLGRRIFSNEIYACARHIDSEDSASCVESLGGLRRDANDIMACAE